MARIKQITRHQIQGERLYNLSIKVDETFIANDILVHNCKSWIRPIILPLTEDQKNRQAKLDSQPTKAGRKSIQFSEISEAADKECQTKCCINL